MTHDQVKEILNRVLTWPAERQADAAEVLTLMEEQDKSGYQLTDEQAAEIRRRFAKTNPKYIPLADIKADFGLGE